MAGSLRRQLQLSYFLENTPNLRIGRQTYGSILAYKGEPFRAFFIMKINAMGVLRVADFVMSPPMSPFVLRLNANKCEHLRQFFRNVFGSG